MKQLLPLLLVCACGLGVSAQQPADEPSAAEPIHRELGLLRERMFKAYAERDVDALLADVEENVVVTWQNGDRVLNKQEFLDFYARMMQGENRIVEEVTSDFEVGGLSLIYGGDAAVAYGTCIDHFRLTSGNEFDLASKWTATVIKTDGHWKVASFHISTDIFDNPILRTAQGWLVYAGVGGGAIGLLVGFCLAWLARKRPPAPAA